MGISTDRYFGDGRNSGDRAPTDAPHPYPKIPLFQSHQTQTSICVHLRLSAVKISISWVGAGLLRLFVVGRNAGEPAPTDAPHPYPKIPLFQSD